MNRHCETPASGDLLRRPLPRSPRRL